MSLTLIIGNKNYSSWSLRPWLFLKYHNIAFEEIRIPLYQKASKAGIEKYLLAGKVPILLDGAITVWESLAILEYLADCYPKCRPWPEDKADRALARSQAAEMHSGFSALSSHCGMNCRRPPRPVVLPAAVEDDVRRIDQIWQDCCQRFAYVGPWLFGHFTVADAMYAPVALRFHSYALPAGPEAQGYIQTVLNHAAVLQWLKAGRRADEIIPAFEEDD